ncbi:tripartite motif-containing protein 2-like [Anneissia japonica]|uniref:tripartite motif-containing protein 2-like n=1 Tax=Anneissia japonica TaxID=1529436 RepID=UPI001425A878|nr:tripartite motif-containing protein 2-like [Anneissia japonica]XP_033105118.1 tripartite motif-containing protein 2-like [Anneissia japonica]
MAESLSKLLECPLCFEEYHLNTKLPKMLPCQHTLCLSCLMRVTKKDQRIKCPVCRASHRAPPNGLASIANNITLIGVLESQTTNGKREAKNMESLKQYLDGKLKTLKKQGKAENTNDEVHEKLNANCKATKEEIDRSFQTQMEMLLRRQRKLHQEVDKHMKDEKERIQESHAEIITELNDIVENCRRIEKKLASADALTENELLTYSQKCTRYELKIQNGKAKLDEVKSVVTFMESHDEDLRISINNFGKVCTIVKENMPRYVSLNCCKKEPVMIGKNILDGNLLEDGPLAVALLANNSIAVTDGVNSCIRIFNKQGKLEYSFGKENLQYPTGLCYNLNEEFVVTDKTGKIRIFSKDGKFLRDLATTDCAIVGMPRMIGITCDGSFKYYVANGKSHQIDVFYPNGKYVCHFSAPEVTMNPQGLTTYNGNIYVTDSNNHCIHIFSLNGQYVNKIGERGKGNGQFELPCGIVCDSNGKIIVADGGNCRVQVFDQTGAWITSYGTKGKGKLQFDSPSGVALSTHGRVIVADRFNGRIQVL